MSTPETPLFAEEFSRTLIKALDQKAQLALSGITNHSAKAYVLAGLLQNLKLPAVWVVEDDDMVVRTAQDLRLFGINQLFAFTEGNGDPDTVQRRATTAFSRVLAGSANVIVATRSFLEQLTVPSAYDLEKGKVTLVTGQELDVTGVFSRLIDMGYDVSESSILTPGTYIRRGGVIDLFPVNRDMPVRIELWGDQIETIQIFDPTTQRVHGDLTTFDIYPLTVPREPIAVQDHLTRALVIHDELNEPFPIGQLTITFVPFNEEEDAATKTDVELRSVLRFHTPEDFARDLKDRLSRNLHWKALIVTSDTEKVWQLLVAQDCTDDELQRVALLSPVRANREGVTADVHADEDGSYRALLTGYPDAFASPTLGVTLVTEREIFGTFDRESRAKSSTQIDAAFLATLTPGDMVVHIDYGLAIFQGIERKTVAGKTREYLHLEFAKNDRLFTPVDQADKVNKYIGATGENAPQLTRLGTSDWSQVTRKARSETLQIAKELLELYALREASRGFAFPPDDDVIRRFEQEFPYMETPGQTRTMVEVKADMERIRPMDRLVCGDVGFGKTEIGMRAAFKAVRAGKQVAYLAPITILVAQQFESFTKRMANFDVRIEMLSRFVTPAKQREVIAALKAGEVDIVIGTHRLLEEDVVFNDLGLVIIDEEQRFGVRQKEKLKQLRASVDILTLSATPVPRTLNMALSGLRDISTITTPPPGRLPIATEVRRFSLTFIRDVILRELERKGQVYFLHNRVQTIESTAEKLRALVPEARIIVAHGQLAPHDLEDRIMAFKNQEFDVLVSSTIIENGIDLPNANTLVVDRAERLGLAQAYQLRGRVGRSKTQAYAYFLYHSQKLDETAKKRLKAIVEAAELGSGFQIALRDLEIRGAGDILGDRQHGAINAIGVTHFTRLLKSAVEQMQAGHSHEELLERPPVEAAIELNVSSFIAETYIPKDADKLKMYQRLAGATTVTALEQVARDMVELHGAPPEETRNLLEIHALKILASNAGVTHVKQALSGRELCVELECSREVRPEQVIHLLAFEPRWVVSGTALRIPVAALGENWFHQLRTHIQHLIVAVEKGAPKKGSGKKRNAAPPAEPTPPAPMPRASGSGA